ncbi:MAG: DUF3368 domain-containing protein [Bryobacterales bacterium]|nr:DUF3368 domain-containing protein [Bryobacterales bacterium]MBV9396621.1 DUF3368 domain-containing protein [Bryobacterales bacterium]
MRHRELVDAFPQYLHLGEREAILLAEEMNAELLIDDRAARIVAHTRGLAHFGSLRVLKHGKELGLVNHVRPVLDDLILSGSYIGKNLYVEFLRQVGQAVE